MTPAPVLPAVLVVSGGGFQGLGIVRLLAEGEGFRIVVADTHAVGVSAEFADAFRRVPPVASGAEFLAAIAAVCRDEGVALVLPATDHELEPLARRREALEAEGARIAVSELAFLALARDKAAFAQAAAREGLPVLPAREPLAANLPLVGKPRGGWGSRGLVFARDERSLVDLPEAERERLFWQELLLDPEEISVDFAVDFGGAISPLGLRRRVRISGGFAVVSETVEDAEVRTVAQRLAEWAAARGGRGLFNAQLLRSGDRVVISDLNPRLGTSAPHWRGSGFNPVLWLCASLGLAPHGAGGEAPRSRRSVRHLEETILEVPADAAGVLGLVLDLDDTLVPAKRWLRARLDLVIERLVPDVGREGARAAARRLVEEGPRDRLVDALAAALGWDEARRVAFLEVYRETFPASCEAYPDVRPALSTLRRRGLRLALLTDNPPRTQRAKLAASGLEPFFDAVVFSRDHGGDKPAPEPFAAAAGAIGLPADRLAMAGDNPYRDLAGAAGAGFRRLFLVRRPGAFWSFDPAVWSGLLGAARFEPVADLRQIAARLNGAAVPPPPPRPRTRA